MNGEYFSEQQHLKHTDYKFGINNILIDFIKLSIVKLF